MSKKKIAEIVPKQNAKSREAKAPAVPARAPRQTSGAQVRVMPPADAALPLVKKRALPLADNNAEIAVPLLLGFENKAGHYELSRTEGDQAYYSFTNRQGKTVDAVMSVTMWRRMQARADSTYKETA